MQGCILYAELENMKDLQEIMFVGCKRVWVAIEFYCSPVRMTTLLPSGRLAYAEEILLL